MVDGDDKQGLGGVMVDGWLPTSAGARVMVHGVSFVARGRRDPAASLFWLANINY